VSIEYDSIWGFKNDILELRKKFMEKLSAQISQPVGIPLHRYVGKLTLDTTKLMLSGRNKDTNEPFEVIISRKKIVETHLGWDDVLRRWKDTRAWYRPLRVTFKENEENKILYVYAKKPNAIIYGPENKKLYKLLGDGSQRR
jgi:hypothetical protein